MVRVIPLLLVLALATGCVPRLERYDYRRIVMGVEARVSLYAPDEATARTAAGAAFERMHALNDCLSDWTDRSELSRLVARARDAEVVVEAGEDLRAVIERAEEVSRASSGAFDLTVAPLVRLWRTARETRTLPDVTAALARVGFERVRVEGTRVRLAAGTELDPGGIGKGYALDAALAVLADHGTPRALVDLGGDLALGTPPPASTGWTVTVAAGLAEPVTLVLRDCGIATSGDAVQFVEIDGVRYSHLVDPRTGLGLTERIAVTVITPSATDADALASAVSVLGAKRGAALIESWPGAAARIETVDPAGVRTTSRFPG